LRLAKSEQDPLGEQHLRLDQMHEGLPVWPCELIVHLDTAGNVNSVESAFIATPEGVPTTPLLGAEQALQSARNHLAIESSTENTQPGLIIYGPLDGSPRLAWKFNLTAGITRAWECAVDAMDGTVLAAFSLVHDGAAGWLGC
jgi:bacillolysin